MLNIKGYRILVEIDPVEKVSEGGIIITLDKDEKLEAAGSQFGTVVSIGDTCWTDAKGEPLTQWCEEGDKILFSKYAGRFVYDPEDKDRELMVINDTDVIAVTETKE